MNTGGGDAQAVGRIGAREATFWQVGQNLVWVFQRSSISSRLGLLLMPGCAPAAHGMCSPARFHHSRKEMTPYNAPAIDTATNIDTPWELITRPCEIKSAIPHTMHLHSFIMHVLPRNNTRRCHTSSREPLAEEAFHQRRLDCW